MRIKAISMSFALSLPTVAATAAELLVNQSSCADQNTYCDIQSAIDAASDGYTVILGKGDYELWQESITIEKSITLQGDAPENTVLSGEGNAPSALIMVSSSAGQVVLKNLTLADRIVSGSSTMGPGGLDFRGEGLAGC